MDIDNLDPAQASFGFYDSQENQNYPNKLIDYSSLVLNTSGIVDTFIFKDVEPGLYWFSFWISVDAQNTTFRYHPGTSANCVGWRPENGDTGAMAPILGFFEIGQQTTVMPNTAPDDMAALSSPIVPAIFAKMQSQ